METRSTAEVGALIRARRLELRISEKRLQAAAKIDTKTLKGMESGERWPQEETRMKVEAELQWMPGSIQALRDGGTATSLVVDDAVPDVQPSPLQAVSDDELLSEIRRRFEEGRSSAGVYPVAGDERKHPFPEVFYRGSDASDPGEAAGELRRQQGR
jgi:transcriptional regulator with XRE-family HTH domain